MSEPAETDLGTNHAEGDLARVLEPIDPWRTTTPAEERARFFQGRHPEMSVTALARCRPDVVLAAFYGAAGRQISLELGYFRFTHAEAARAGGTLRVSPSDPPWPPEYSEAHRDLTGDAPRIAAAMVEIHDADAARVVLVDRLMVFHQIAALLGRPDVHERFAKAGTKHIRRLLQLPKERDELWVPLAAAHGHLLDDAQTQGELRRLYNADRAAWFRISKAVPRIGEDPLFSTGARKG